MSEELEAESLSESRMFRVDWFAPQRPVATTVFLRPAPNEDETVSGSPLDEAAELSAPHTRNVM